VAELYSCPETQSLSRVQIHSIRFTSYRRVVFTLLLDSTTFICCRIAFASYFIRLRIFDSRGYILFSFLIFSLSRFRLPSISLSFVSLSRSILLVQSARLLFILYHKTYIRIHSRVTRSYTTNVQMKQMLLLTENVHTYIYVREYLHIRTYMYTNTYTYVYIYVHTCPSEHTHTYTYIKYMYIIYCSHSHGLSSPL